MAEHLLDHLDVGAGGDRQAGGGVPQLVRVQAGKTDDPGRCGEGGAEGGHPQGAPVADPAEHQVFGLPAGHLSGEAGDEEARDRDLAPLVGLGRTPHQARAGDLSHRLGDDRTAAGKVQTTDSKRGHLAEPDAGVGQEQHHQPVGLVAAGGVVAVLVGLGRVSARLCECFDLGVGEVASLVPDRSRQVHSGGDVASEPSVLDRHVQHQ